MSPFPREAYRPLSRYAPDRRPIEVDLSDNTNRWGAHPAALRILREAPVEDLVRYPSVYADGFRIAVARRFGVPEECVATGCGSDDLLDSTFRAAGEPGESIAYLPPTFSMVEIFARMNGMEATPVDAARADDPRALLEGDPAVVYLCRPNNPTGASEPREWVERLIEAVGADGPLLLLDEAYADFAEDDFLAPAASSKRVVVVRTLSKAYGLAGLRIGFAVGPAEVIAEVEKSRGPYKVSRPAERAAVAAILDEEGWVPNIVAMVKAERTRLLGELRARGLSPLPSSANFLLLPVGEGKGVSMGGAALGGGAMAVTAALRERGVAVRPFPALPGIGDTIRISIGPAEEMDRFLSALDVVS
jgi:histidinol-phosphate aminotransferase